MISKLIWLWKKFWGFQMRIEVNEKLKEDEVLLYGHILYLPSTSILSKNDKY